MLVYRLQILLAALLFSTGGAAVKACSLNAWQVASLRSGVAAVVLLLALPTWRRFWTPRALLVGLAYATTMICYVVGNKLTTAANMVFLQATAPMYVLLLGPWLLRERIRLADAWLTIAMVFGMALFFMGTEPAVETATDPLRGNLVGILAGVSWSFTILGLRWLGRGASDSAHDPTGSAVVAGNVLACVIALPLALPFTGGDAGDWTIIAYLGTFQIGVAYIAMTRGIRRVPALEASLLLLLEPVLAAFWAWLIHGERPGSWSLAGCLVIFAASVAAASRRGPGEPLAQE